MKYFEEGTEIMHPLSASFIEVSNILFCSAAPIQKTDISHFAGVRRFNASDRDERSTEGDRGSILQAVVKFWSEDYCSIHRIPGDHKIP